MLPGRVGPQPVKPVKIPDFLVKDMDYDVIVIKQGPQGVFAAFDAQWEDLLPGQPLFYSVHDRREPAAGRGCHKQEPVCDAAKLLHVHQDYVLALLVGRQGAGRFRDLARSSFVFLSTHSVVLDKME